MGGVEKIDIEIVYALPERQHVQCAQVAAGTTVAQALQGTALLRQFPEIDLERDRLGIFGRRVSADTILRAGDRVEIYRPLIADPKAVRRAHAQAHGKPRGRRAEPEI